MQEILAPAEIVITGRVLRCGCGAPDSHSQSSPPQPCPTPREIEVLGVLGEDGQWHSHREA